MSVQREAINQKILFVVIFLLTMFPAFRSENWYQSIFLVSMTYTIGLCVPLWMVIKHPEQSIYTYLPISAFLSFFAPFFSSVLGSLMFSIPVHMEFPLNTSMTLFTTATFLWFVAKYVGKMSMLLVSFLGVMFLITPFGLKEPKKDFANQKEITSKSKIAAKENCFRRRR